VDGDRQVQKARAVSDGAYSTGGVGGERALTEDLDWAASALREAAADVRAASAAIARRRTALVLAPPSSVSASALHALESSLAWVSRAGAQRLEDDLDDAAHRLSAVVRVYVDAERAARRSISLVSRVAESVEDLQGDATWVSRLAAAAAWRVSTPGILAVLAGHDPVGGALTPDGPPPTTGWLTRDSAERAIASLPGYEAIAAALAGALAALELLAGEPRARGVTPHAAAPNPSRSLASMMARLKGVEDRDDGSVRIDAWTGGDGVTRRIVYIPGTEDWGVWSGNPADAQANLALMAGGMPGAARTVIDALSASGATPDEPVLLVGHSEGGIVAAALAASPAVAARFRVAGVVTAGSPVGRIALPPPVAALHLEGTRDLVPGLDGRTNPDTPTRTTVSHDTRRSDLPALEGAGETVASAHALATYAETARLVDEGLTPSTDAWLSDAKEFFEPGADVTTTNYVPRASGG